MPEGPELKYSAIYLNSILKNDIIQELFVFSRKNVILPKKSKIVNIDCKGKLLWIETKDYIIHIHYFITGWIYLNEKPNYTKYIIKTNNNKIYIDSMRKFTKLDIHNKKDHLKFINKLGLDILSNDFTLEYFIKQFNKTNTIISPFLLKQDKFAGLGNYIKSESLYLSKINPKTKTKNIDIKKLEKLYNKIKFVAFSQLLTHIYYHNKEHKKKINIDNNLKKILPDKLKVPYQFYVYSKIKDKYGNKIKKEKIGGRWTYYI